MAWYYAVNQLQQGPVEREELIRLAQSGAIRADDLVWAPELGDQWVAAGSLTWLLGAPMPPPVPATPAIPPAAGRGLRGSTSNADLMQSARGALTGRWGVTIGACLVTVLVPLAANVVPVFGGLAGLLLGAPLSLGLAAFFLTALRGDRPEAVTVGRIFDGFQRFGDAVGAQFMMGLFILLWTLLLIVPGIMAAYSYSMTFYVLADNPAMGAMEGIRRSKELMAGHRWKLFCLGCRFIGWALLCILTLGIGFIWLWPYMNASYAAFYEDVR